MLQGAVTRVRNRARNDEAGFTLIELLVVVIIIGILAAIAIPTFLNQRKKGWESAVKSDLRNYAIVAETQLTETGTYAGLTSPAPNMSDDVTVTVVGASTDTYCLEGTHANLDDTWSLRPGGALAKAACTTATTTTP